MNFLQRFTLVSLTLCSLTVSVSRAIPINETSAAEALAKLEQLLNTTTSQPQRFYLTTEAAAAALAADETAKATMYSQSLLEQAARLPNNWNYGNAVHVAHLVLGHVALNAGDVAEAKRQLLEAGKTPGSPQLNSFGPNMRLAQQLLAKGERDAVLQYFDLCSVFWELQGERLSTWQAIVREGREPQFGANLVYHLDYWRKLGRYTQEPK